MFSLSLYGFLFTHSPQVAGPEYALSIPRTTDFLTQTLQPTPTFVLPLHCTGFNGKTALRAALGDAVVPAGTGGSYEVLGIPEEDERLEVTLTS
jgi:7,8-dihydropterin-6-yl-methyl-4-(beta-D-ribofuranosyl)aminobenzene 5'-phosphate synthase